MTTPDGTVAVWDVEAESVRWVTAGEAVAGLVRYAQQWLGAGTPACGVAERRAVELTSTPIPDPTPTLRRPRD